MINKEKFMIKLPAAFQLKNLSLIAAVFAVASCNSSSTTPSNPSSWHLVGTSIQTPNVVLKSLAISETGVLYAGGTVDVNNSGVESISIITGGNWGFVGGGFIPNPVNPQLGSYIRQISAITITANNTVLAAINDNYINGTVVSSESNSWQLYVAAGLVPSGIINSLAVDANNIIYAATAAYDAVNNQYIGNVYSGQAQGIWQQIGGGAMPDGGVANSVILADAKTIYVAAGGPNVNLKNGYVGDVYRSVFSNGNWSNWIQVGGGSMPDGGVASSLASASSNGVMLVYIGTSKGNIYSSNGSSAWSRVGGSEMPDGGAINSLAVTQTSATPAIYSATSKGHIYGTNGNNWQMIGGGSSPDGWFANSVAVYKGQVYIVTQGGNTYSAKSVIP